MMSDFAPYATLYTPGVEKEGSMERIPAVPMWILLSSVTCIGLVLACLGLALILVSRYKAIGIVVSALGLLMSGSTLVVFWFAPVWS